jgi:hypothetical protein
MPSLYGFAKEQDATNVKKNALVGCPKIIFYLQQIKNYKFPLMNHYITRHKFEV